MKGSVMNDTVRDFYVALEKILLRCWIFGAVLLLLWWGAYMLLHDVIHRLHGGMFGISEHEMALIFYCGMGLLKLAVSMLFFLPWLATWMVLRKG